MNYTFSISLKHQYVFCEVAKSGCSAVKRALWRQELADVPMPKGFEETYKNVHVAFPHHLLIKPFQLGQARFNQLIRDPSFLKWTVVRNPFTRALSGFLDKVGRNEPQFANVRGGIAELRGVKPEDVDHATVTFEEFCYALQRFKKPLEFDPHWRPQVAHTCADILPYDYVAKLETLDESEGEIARRIGLKNLSFNSKRPHATHANTKLLEHFTERSGEIIRKVYAEDFARFGFGLDVPG